MPEGAATNFFLHLHAGELDDARAYFAPGLVIPSPQLDQSIVDASDRLRAYSINRDKPEMEELGNGQVRVTLRGAIEPRTESGPTPQPTPDGDSVDILTVLLVERGPGWRILEFSVLCCPQQR